MVSTSQIEVMAEFLKKFLANQPIWQMADSMAGQSEMLTV
jgi:hypothetical protein